MFAGKKKFRDVLRDSEPGFLLPEVDFRPSLKRTLFIVRLQTAVKRFPWQRENFCAYADTDNMTA